GISDGKVSSRPPSSESLLDHLIGHTSRGSYCFGVARVATLALPTFTADSELRSDGVATARFSGQVASFRSSPTVFADTPMPGSVSTRILSGKPPRATWSAPMLLGLYRTMASHTSCHRHSSRTRYRLARSPRAKVSGLSPVGPYCKYQGFCTQ